MTEPQPETAHARIERVLNHAVLGIIGLSGIALFANLAAVFAGGRSVWMYAWYNTAIYPGMALAAIKWLLHLVRSQKNPESGRYALIYLSILMAPLAASRVIDAHERTMEREAAQLEAWNVRGVGGVELARRKQKEDEARAAAAAQMAAEAALPELMAAVQDGCGNPAAVKRALERGADPARWDGQAFHAAVRRGNAEIVEMLLAAQPHITDSWRQLQGDSDCSSDEKREAVARILIRDRRFDYNANGGAYHPMVDALMHRRPRIAEMLLEAGMSTQLANANMVYGYHVTPLDAALLSGESGFARKLMARGEVFALEPGQWESKSATAADRANEFLAAAAEHGDAWAVDFILEAARKAEIPAEQVDLIQALGMAVKGNCADCATRLLAAGARLDKPLFDGRTYFWEEDVGGAGAALLEVLDRHGMMRLRRPDALLRMAVEAGNADGARWLLRHGAQPEATDRDAQLTPLMRAAQLGNADMIRALLAGGAKVNGPEVSASSRIDGAGSGRTPLMLAAQAGQLDALRELLRAGADMFRRDARGASAKVLGAAHAEILEALEAAGDRTYAEAQMPGSAYDAQVSGKPQVDVGGVVYRALPFLPQTLRFFAVDVEKPEPPPGGKARSSSPRCPRKPAWLYAVLPDRSVVKLVTAADYAALGMKIDAADEGLQFVRYLSDSPVAGCRQMYRVEGMDYMEIPENRECQVVAGTQRKATLTAVRGGGFRIVRRVRRVDAGRDEPALFELEEFVGRDGAFRRGAVRPLKGETFRVSYCAVR